jgi:pSer/pThr/pTyr-binding forkhead associated (FHA) protein
VPHPSLSRLHCRFKFDGENLSVGDMESLNGTIVDGRKLAKDEFTVLKPGSRLNLGEVTLTLGDMSSGRG